MAKTKHKGRPGKTKTEYLLRQQVERLISINDGLAAAKSALDNEASEVLEEVVRMAEVQQDMINELNKRLDRLEGKEDVGEETIEEIEKECSETRTEVPGEE